MKMFPPPAVRAYNPALRAIHWLMALVIVCALALGVWATQLPRGDLRSEVLFVHKSFGVIALGLIALRIVVRLAAGAPPYAAPLGRIVSAASRSAHLALYALMIAMPATGYVTSSAGGHEAPFFGFFALPNVAPRDQWLAEAASQAHFVFAWTIGIVLALHLAAVLWHARVKRDTVFARMALWAAPTRAAR